MLLALATPKLWDRFSLALASPLPLWRECRPAVGAAPQLPFPPRSRGGPQPPHIAATVAPPAPHPGRRSISTQPSSPPCSGVSPAHELHSCP